MAVLLVLIVFAVLLLIGSVGVIAVGRRRARRAPYVEPPPIRRPPEAPRPERVVESEPAPAVVEAPPVPEPVVQPAPPVEAPPKPRFRDRLGKARSQFSGYVGSVLSRNAIDDTTWDELEEALILADVGVGATTAILDDLRGRVKSDG